MGNLLYWKLLIDNHLCTCILVSPNGTIIKGTYNFSWDERFPTWIPNGFQRRSQVMYVHISICGIHAYMYITERSYRFGNCFLLQAILQANYFLFINSCAALHTIIIWATHHLPQVDDYTVLPVECSRPIFNLLRSSMFWFNMKPELMKLLLVKNKQSKYANELITEEKVVHLQLFSIQQTLPVFIYIWIKWSTRKQVRIILYLKVFFIKCLSFYYNQTQEKTQISRNTRGSLQI